HGAEAYAVLLEPAPIGGVDLVAVAVAFGNVDAAIDAGGLPAALEHRRIGAEPHGAAEIAVAAAPVQLVAFHPFGHQPDHGLGGGAELRRIGLADAAQIARRLHHRHLHAEADAEIGHVPLARELRRLDLAFGAALAEAARHQDAVHMLEERGGILALEHLALDPVEIDLDLVGDAAVRQRLDQRLIGVLHPGILADHRDGDVAFRVA